MQKQNRIAIYLITLGAFTLGMASYITAGLLPLLQADFTVSAGVAAQLVSAFTLAYGIGSPIVVALLPANKQRLGLLFALALLTFANIASALSVGFIGLMAWRVLAGVGAGVYLACGIAAAAALADKNARGKAIAILMGGMASGVVLGVPIGLFLAEHAGWQAALWLTAGLGVLTLLGLLRYLPALPDMAAVAIADKLRLLGDGQVLRVLAVSLLAAVASLGMYTFMTPLLAESGAQLSVTPYLWVWGVGGVAGSFLIGLLTRYRDTHLSFAIMLLLAVALLALPITLAIHPWLMLLPIALWGAVGWALQTPQNNRLIHIRQSQGDGNLAVSLNESALYLGSTIGAAVGGFMLESGISATGLAYAAGAVALMGVAVQVWEIRASRAQQ